MSKGVQAKKRGKKAEATIGSISSINEVESDQKIRLEGGDFQDLEDFDIEQLRMDDLYRSKSSMGAAIHQRDSVFACEEFIKRLFSNTMAVLQEKQINIKIPSHTIKCSLQTAEKAMQVLYIHHDNSKLDFITKGLLEDTEPSAICGDTWLRAKIQVDTCYREDEQVFNLPMASKPADVQSKARSSKSSSITMLTKRIGEGGIEKRNHQMIPAPIDLAEQLNVSITEENLRSKKENERKEREDKVNYDIQKRQNMINDEQQKLTKFQKEKKTAGFTYDYNGELIPVQKVKLNKLPPSAQSVSYGFKEEEDLASKEIKKKKKNVKPSETVSKFKKAPEQEKEFARLIANQPPVFDNIPLNIGVSLQYEGRKRVGPRPNAVELASLTLTGAQKVRLGKKQYDELIKNGGFNRTKVDSHDNNNNNDKMIMSSGNQRYISSSQYEQNDMSTIEKMRFIQKIQNNTTGNMTENKKGNIKISSAKMYETFTQQIDENEEIEFRRQKELEQRKRDAFAASQVGLNKSPIDEFNLQITHQQEWGKSHYGTGNFGTLQQYQMHRPSEKQSLESIGKNKQRPRDRFLRNELPLLGASQNFDLRAATSEGFFRRQLKTSEGNRAPQQQRIGTGNPNNNNNNNNPSSLIQNNSNPSNNSKKEGN